MDERFTRLAKGLIGYSCALKKGERVLIASNGFAAMPLVRALIKEAYAVGAYPYVDITSNVITRELLLGASKEQYEPLAEIDGKRWK
jgi:aminopeptidase